MKAGGDCERNTSHRKMSSKQDGMADRLEDKSYYPAGELGLRVTASGEKEKPHLLELID